MELKKITVKAKLGVIDIDGTWEPNDKEKEAAWELYVELITRISIVELKEDEGSLREALSSLHTFFKTTRELLRKYGPKVVKGDNVKDISLGMLAIAISNIVIRPVLAKWHPLLLDYETKKAEGASIIEHEREWKMGKELRRVLNLTRLTLIEYATLLADVANVPLLIFSEKSLVVKESVTPMEIKTFAIDIRA